MATALIFFLLFGLLLELLPLIRDLICGLVLEVFPLLIRAVVGLIAMSCHGIAMAVRFIWALLVFLYYLADEALHSEADPEETLVDEEDVYEKALSLLGLHEDCTQEELTRAFRSAMAQAHPDKGGTDEQAMAVNAARNIIKSHKGWR
jgi:hypothetical protein